MFAHLDMDCFFAAVEEVKDPSLRGKPVAIGHPGGRGVISTASYAARRFGVHSAMPTDRALKLCPSLILLPGNMALYSRFSKDVAEVCRSFCADLQQFSIDEFYFDLSRSQTMFERRYGGLAPAMENLRGRVKEKTGLNCSVGLARYPLWAKMATEDAKPDGLFEVTETNSKAWLYSKKVSAVPGIGVKTTEKMGRLGIYLISDLLAFDMNSRALPTAMSHLIENWQAILGGRGNFGHWQNDRFDFSKTDRAKSWSHERTFGKDVFSSEQCIDTCLGLLENVLQRVRKDNVTARTLSLKVRLAPFETFQHSRTWREGIQTSAQVLPFIKKTLKERYSHQPVRLLGIRLSNANETMQYDLFDQPAQKSRSLSGVIDRVQDRFGKKAVYRGSHVLNDRVNSFQKPAGGQPGQTK